jgi:hypothetical protein
MSLVKCLGGICIVSFFRELELENILLNEELWDSNQLPFHDIRMKIYLF